MAEALAAPAPEGQIERASRQYAESRQIYEADAPSESAVALGKVPGVPLKEGVDTWTYLQYKNRQNVEEQVRFLARQFGEDNVRINDFGKPVVRTIDPVTKKPVDRTVDPWDINSKSILGFVVQEAPAVAATAIAMRGGRPAAVASKLKGVPGVGKLASRDWLFKSTLGAGVYESVKALQEAAGKEYDRPVLDLAGIIGEHAAAVPVDVAMDMTLLGGLRTSDWAWRVASGKTAPRPVETAKRSAQWLMSRFAKETDQSKIGKAAMAYWEKKGTPYKATLGELSDLPIVAKSEAYLGQQAAGAASLEADKLAKEESFRNIQRYMYGPGTLPLDEEVGRRGIAALSQAYEATEKALAKQSEQSAANLAQSAQARLLGYFNLRSLPERGYPVIETGDLLQSMGVKARDTWTGLVGEKYARLYEHPLAATRTHPGDALANYAAKTKGEMLSAEREVEKAGYDAYGSPIDLTTTERTPLKSLDITGVIPILDDLSKLKGQKLSVLDLKHARTAIQDAINRSLALTDTRGHYLTEIAEAIDGELQKSIDAAGDGTLRALWDDASGTYKTGVAKFKNKLLAPLWAKPDEMIVDNERLFNSAVNSSARYRSLVDFFGKGSDAVNGFQETAIKQLFAKSLADTGNVVELGKLFERSKGLAESNALLYKDIVGNSKLGNLLDELKLNKALEGKVALEDLVDLMNRKGTVYGRDLANLISAEQQRAKIFNNSVVKKFVRGELEPEALNPESFVRFLSESNVQDVKEVVDRLSAGTSPAAKATLYDLRRKTLQAIFRKAGRNPTSIDITRELQGDPTYVFSPTGLRDVLGTDEQKAVYREILGKDKYEELTQAAALQVLEQQKLERAKGTGLLASGESTGGFWRAVMNPGKHASGMLSEWAKMKAISVMMSRDWGKEMLLAAGTAPSKPPVILPPLADKATAAIVTSAPFLKDLTAEFSDPFVRFQVLSWLKRTTGLSSEATPPADNMEQFEKGLKPPPTPEGY